MAFALRKSVFAVAIVMAVGAVSAVFGKPFLTYGVDWLSIRVRGHVAPAQEFYLTTTRKDGDAVIDRILDEAAQAEGWRVSRADWDDKYGDESSEPRELWRPGASVFVMREFACQRPNEIDVRFRTDAFVVEATRISFLTSPAALSEFVENLRVRFAASPEIRIVPARPRCPGDGPA